MEQPKTKIFQIKYFSLTICLISFFALSIIGQFFFGFETYQQELKAEHLPLLRGHWQYLTSGHFISSVAENMESEFLQMALFVYLTMCLYQVGSAESKRPPEMETEKDILEEKKEREYSIQLRKRRPWTSWVFENSLTLVLGSLFVLFFFAHAYGSLEMINFEKVASSEPPIKYWGVFSESDFWFESFQNWQSEFFSIAIMSLLSIFLRQKGSPQSKKIYEPNWKTGD